MVKKHKYLITKLAVFTMIVVGFSLALSGGQVSAVTCPAKYDTSIPPSWGIQDDGLDNHFATVAVYAYNSRTNEPLNVKYSLNSSVDPNFNYGPAPIGDDGTKVPASQWPDARIFKVHIADSTIKTDARWKQRWFETGTTLSAPATNPCPGWDELGPGTSNYQGNGFVVDCQEVGTDGNKHNNRFWIDSITKPAGADGEWGGSWRIEASSGGENLTNRGYPMNGTSSWLSVINGQNARIHLIWTPNDPPPPPPPPENDCSFSRITGSKLVRKRVQVSRISGGDSFYDGNPDGTHAGDIDAWVPSPPGEEVDGAHTKRWNYKAKALTIHIKVTESEWKDNTADSVANPHWVDTVLRDDDVLCYDATCDLGMVGNVPGRPNGVKSGSGFTVNADVYNRANGPNTTELYALVDGRPLILASNDGSPVGFWYNPGAPNGLNKGAHSYPSWNVGEPGWGINTYGIGAKLYYDFDPTPGIQAGDLVLADCTGTSYDVYKQFDLSLSTSVTLSPTVEDPNNVRFTGRADAGTYYGIPGEYGGHINVNYSANARKTAYGGFEQVINSQSGTTSTPVLYNWSTNPQPNHAGDKYFMNNSDFCVAQTNGWIGPGNNFSSDTYGSCSLGDQKHIYDRPYVKTYGGDVVAGANFKGAASCNNSQPIRAYRSTSASKSGSGSQLAALAFAQISGFGSSSLLSGWPNGLSFANNIGVGGSFGEDQPGDGGSYAGDAVCTKDYFSTLQDDHKNLSAASTTVAGISSLVNSQNGGKATQFYRNGNLTITTGGNFDKQAVLFVDGDVTIRGDISFSPGSYFAIIAKGNIKIAGSVHGLDGLYVAQPNGSSDGVIYTCTQNNGSLYGTVNALYDNCRSQLTVNGAFVAKKVKFLRTANSLRDSGAHESAASTKAAEVFNFTPEIYLYTPVFEDVTTTQPYQYITTLPPVL